MVTIEESFAEEMGGIYVPDLVLHVADLYYCSDHHCWAWHGSLLCFGLRTCHCVLRETG